MIKSIPISEIQIGDRHRVDLGDIDALAQSIEGRGLLHPPVVTTDGELVCGFRRLEAVKRLGWDSIEVRAIDPDDLLLAERDENEVRKDFTVSERVAIAKAIEDRIGNRRGQRSDLRKESEGSGNQLRRNCDEVQPEQHSELVGNCPQVEQGQKTREIAAKAAGFRDDRTYRRATSVVGNGSPELVEAMDRGEVSVSAAAEVARLPEPEQAEVIEKGPEAVKEVARDLRTARQRAREEELEQALTQMVGADDEDDEQEGLFPEPGDETPPVTPTPIREESPAAGLQKWRDLLTGINTHLVAFGKAGGLLGMTRGRRKDALRLRNYAAEIRDRLDAYIREFDATTTQEPK